MQPLRYSINITLDGCCHHNAITPHEGMVRVAEENIARADVLLFGKTIYTMMESAWRISDPGIAKTIDPSMESFARTIDAKKKVVVSSTLQSVDWNAELLKGDLAAEVRRLKEQPGNGIATGGLTLPLALAELGLIDEYEFMVHPRIAGHGPRFFDGLSRYVDLKLVQRREIGEGAEALLFVPKG